MIPAKDIYIVRVLRAVTSNLYEIRCIFGGPDKMAILIISPMELWIKTIELESPQKSVVLVMATCPKSTASLGAKIGDLSEI